MCDIGIDSIGTSSLPGKRENDDNRQQRFITKEQTLLPGFWRQLYATIAVSFTAFSTGNVLGWMGPMVLVLPSRKSQVEGVTAQSLIDLLTIMQLSSIFNMMVCGFMMDSMGRRAGCWFLNLFAPAGWVFLAMARTTTDLYIGGLMVGSTMVAGLVVGVVFITEVTNETLRGPFLSIIVFFHSCGALFSHILGEFLEYKLFNLCCLVFSLLFPFFFHPLPESPMFLILKSRFAEAKTSLEWYQGNDPQAVEFEMQKLLNSGKKSTNAFKTMISSREDKISLATILFLGIFSELCGTTVVETYTGVIIKETIGRPDIASQKTLILAFVRFFAGLISVYFVEKTGRKKILSASLGVMAGSLLAVSLILRFADSSENDVWIVCSVLGIYTLANQLGLAAGEIVSSEIAVPGKRGMFMAIGGTFKIVTLIFCLQIHTILSRVSDDADLIFEAVCCAVGLIIVVRAVPETYGKTLASISEEMEKGVVPPRRDITLPTREIFHLKPMQDL